MQIFDSNGNAFRFSILGYQYPEKKFEDYDSNWLIIEVDVTYSQKRWNARDACLLTYEVARLAQWFESIAGGISVESIQKFIEPNLEFHLVDISSEQYLRIFFEFELRPEWAKWDQKIMKDFWIDFSLSKLDLYQTASSLRRQLADYPQRAKN